MSLTLRQTSLYQHRIDIWSSTRTVGGVTPGKPSGEVLTLIKQNHPVLFEYTPNIDSETSAGRLKEFTMLVLDKIHAEANSPLLDMYVTVNVTYLADGSKANTWGDVHRIEGAPTISDSLGRRHANSLVVQAMSMEHAPDVIRSFYSI